MAKIRNANYIVIDVETTGPNANKNRITEIGCIAIKGREVIDEYSTLMNPHQSIPSFISKMTGITNEMVFTAPESADALIKVKELLEQPNTIFVAHNANFDWGFVLETFKRNGLVMPDIPVLCTFKLSKKVLPKDIKKNVGALAQYFKIPIINRHRALDDAKATGYILLELLDRIEEEHNISDIDELLKFQNLRIKSKSQELVDNEVYKKVKNVPDQPGVYYFLDKDMMPLYIGKSKSLKERIYQHLNSSDDKNDKMSEVVRKSNDITWTTTTNELEALIKESREIKKYKPKYNSVLKKHKNYPFIKFSTDKYPILEKTYVIEDDGAEYFGPFRSKRLVSQIIENVEKQFRLRKCKFSENMVCDNCFYFQINKCVGPESEKYNIKDYNNEIEKVRFFLRSYNNGILSDMTDKMLQKSESLDFENASRLKRNIDELKVILNRQQDVSTSIRDNNLILMMPDEESPRLIDLFFIRCGSLFNQITLGRKAPLTKAYEIATKAYFNGTPKKKKFSSDDIDEMKIINCWLYSNRNAGKFIYIAQKTQEEVFKEIEHNFKTDLSKVY